MEKFTLILNSDQNIVNYYYSFLIYLNISGLNAMNYIKIKGELNPAKFMNSLAKKILNKFQCKISPDKKKYKLEVIFPNKIKEEIENEEGMEDEENKII